MMINHNAKCYIEQFYLKKIADGSILEFSTIFPSYIYIYEARSQVEARIWDITQDFEEFRTHMLQSVEKYLDVVGTWLKVRLKADDPYFQIRKKYW